GGPVERSPPQTPLFASRTSLWLARSCYTVAVARRITARAALLHRRCRSWLQPVQVLHGALILHLVGGEGSFRFEQDDVDLGGQRFGAVLDAAGDDDELTGADVAVA